MLEVEDKSFSIVQNETPKGYGKIEIKNGQGTLAINCQNLKSGGNIERYRWYLINTKKENEPLIVEVGPMEVDEKGKGELIWEFNVENVRGSMEEIDNFDVLVLVAKNRDHKKNIFVPLVGYMDKEKSTSWRYALERHLYMPLGKEMEELKEVKEEELEKLDEVKEEKQEVEEAKGLEEDKNASIEIIESRTIESKADEEVYEHIEDQGEYIEIKDNVDEILKNPDALEEDLLNDEESYRIQMQGYIENTLKDFYRVDPFVNNFENYCWWQIPYNHQTIYRSYMPFILYIDSVKGPINYYASKMLQTIYLHRHHIFGIQYDENGEAKYYAYGIPGRNIASDQPYEGATGFTYWHPCDPGPHDAYSHGYWILRIDPKTGKVIEGHKK